MSIFGIKRSKVKELRRKQELETLKSRKSEKELAERTRKAKSEAGYYKAKSEKQKAKKSASFQWPEVSSPRVKVRKKKQGRKLSQKGRIGLI